MDTEKVRELEALLQSGVLDPAALRTIGELGRALIDTAGAPAPPIGLLKALGDPLAAAEDYRSRISSGSMRVPPSVYTDES